MKHSQSEFFKQVIVILSEIDNTAWAPVTSKGYHHFHALRALHLALSKCYMGTMCLKSRGVTQ